MKHSEIKQEIYKSQMELNYPKGSKLSNMKLDKESFINAICVF